MCTIDAGIIIIFFHVEEMISHSLSVDQVRFLSSHVLRDYEDKTLLDIGSRTGALLYGVRRTMHYPQQDTILLALLDHLCESKDASWPQTN